jgi:hypothetical protein
MEKDTDVSAVMSDLNTEVERGLQPASLHDRPPMEFFKLKSKKQYLALICISIPKTCSGPRSGMVHLFKD